MPLSCDPRTTYAVLSIWLCVANVTAQDAGKLPEWKANEVVASQLGDAITVSNVSIRIPYELKQSESVVDPKIAASGIHSYGWTPDGQSPSIENISVTLTPFARPSSDALDKTINGMKGSIQQNLLDVKFGEIRKGKFRGMEARAGTYKATALGEPIVAFYLVAIDTRGTIGGSAMLPEAKATPERMKLLQTALMTLERVQ